MKTKLTLCNLFTLLLVAGIALAEEEPAPKLADSDREAVAIVVLRDYFTKQSGFAERSGLVAFVQIEPKAGEKAQAASDSVKKHFGNRPIVQDASKSERDSGGNVIDPQTGQSSAIITIQPIRTVGDNVVSVRLHAYGGGKSSTNYEYHLKKVDGGWEVASVRRTSIS